MTQATARLHRGHGNSWNFWFASLFSGQRGGPRRKLLDTRTLSDHLKRDLGLLDGNDSSGGMAEDELERGFVTAC
jgi:hypothetical protein